MISFARFTWKAAAAGRWTARIMGTLMVLFVAAFVIGEGIPLRGMTAREQLYGLGVGCLYLGLIVAWFREGWGGLLSVCGWGMLAVLARRSPWDLPFSIPTGLGLVHLLCWWRLRGPAPPAAAGVVSSRVWAVLAAPFAIFLLLCGNEVFGEPPLMAAARMPANIAGTWSADLTMVSRQTLPVAIPVVFVIAPDGSVSGTIGSAPVRDGRLVGNRSWFGRMMHWRTDYLIRGSLSGTVESYGGIAGDRFSAPMFWRGGELEGSLFLFHPGTAMPLGMELRKQAR
jgi:hypothetical protein